MAEVVLKKIEKTYPNGFKAVHGIDLTIDELDNMEELRRSRLLRQVYTIYPDFYKHLKPNKDFDNIVAFIKDSIEGLDVTVSILTTTGIIHPRLSSVITQKIDNIAMLLKSKLDIDKIDVVRHSVDKMAWSSHGTILLDTSQSAVDIFNKSAGSAYHYKSLEDLPLFKSAIYSLMSMFDMEKLSSSVE